MPSYLLSTLKYYYPAPNHPPNYAHISTLSPSFQNQYPLPSASQSHIPLLRHTPSVPPVNNVHIAHVPTSPFFDQINHIKSCNSRSIHSLSPVNILQPQPLPAFNPPPPTFPPPSPVHLPTNIVPPTPIPLLQPHVAHTATEPLQQQTSFITSSLPSTKDDPILTGKHDWGSWHSAVRTLILNTNLFGHIADDPLPGAAFDPGLWPTSYCQSKIFAC